MKIQYILFPVILTLAGLPGKTQTEYNYTYAWGGDTYTWYPGYKPVKGIKQVTCTYTYGEKTTTTVKRYTEDAKPAEIITFDRKNRENHRFVYHYDENKNLSKKEMLKKGEPVSTIGYQFTKQGNPLWVEKKTGKGKVILKSTWKYNDNGCLESSVYYKKQGTKIKSRWEYEYIDSCVKTRSVVYNDKGKIKNEWLFNCNSEGEKLEKKENTTQVCKWNKVSDDTLTKVYQSFNEKGETVKHITKYLLPDTLITESATYNKNDVLTHKWTYDRSSEKPLSYSWYKKGKEKFSTVYSYNGELIQSVKNYKKGGLSSVRMYEYNEEKLVEKETWTDKKTRVIYIAGLTYEKY